MVFIQSNDRKGRYEFRAIQESCKMRSMYKNEIRAKQENNDTCKSVIHTQQRVLRKVIFGIVCQIKFFWIANPTLSQALSNADHRK